MEKVNECKEKKRKRCSFTAAEKVRLAGQVELNPCIWDLSHPKHFNINNVSSAWGSISAAMEKSVEECKDNWAALRDGKRYRMKSARKRKFEDVSGSPIAEQSIDDDWKFGKAMHFLPDNSKKIKTLDSTSSDTMDDVFAQGASKSKYTHNGHRSSKPVVEGNTFLATDVPVQNLNALIESQLQRNEQKRHFKKDREKVLPLKYQTLYAHMDTMLSRLPQKKIDRMSIKILNFITDELYNNE